MGRTMTKFYGPLFDIEHLIEKENCVLIVESYCMDGGIH
jgi:hypothetical protein